MPLILIVADCNFRKGPQQCLWSYTLFQDFATSHQEVNSICVTCKLSHQWQYGLYLVLSVSRCPPLEASHCVVRRLRLYREVAFGVLAHSPSWGPRDSHHWSADMWVSESPDDCGPKPSPRCPVWICDPQTQWASQMVVLHHWVTGRFVTSYSNQITKDRVTSINQKIPSRRRVL